MDETQQESDEPMLQTASAQLAPQTRLEKILGVVPRALSSHVHILFLGALGVFLAATTRCKTGSKRPSRRPNGPRLQP
jgi:hypothetical protein